MPPVHSLSCDEAWARLESAVPEWRPRHENVAVEQACGRLLAEDCVSQVDSPPADNSAMDGFALRSQGVQLNTSLTISQRIPAGTAPQPLEPGTAARVFTGAEIPDGADCVVIQENCDYDDHNVTIKSGLNPGANIRRRASDVSRSDVVATAGTSIRPQEIGFLLSSGIARVNVFEPVRVGVIATGDELVDIQTVSGVDQPELEAGKIFESNSPMIAARLRAMGAIPTRYKAQDTLDDTVRVMTQALNENDMVLTIGGVSVGEEDHVQAALSDLGRTEFWKINIKPGKPFLFGEAAGKPVMGLPGNPVSSFVTFTLFCAPFLSKLMGGSFARPQRLPAVAGFERSKISDRIDHLRGRISEYSPMLVVEPVGSQSSSIQGALCAADVLIVIPENTAVSKGQYLDVIALYDR